MAATLDVKVTKARPWNSGMHPKAITKNSAFFISFLYSLSQLRKLSICIINLWIFIAKN
jgi:hypothetical protein